MTLHLPLVRRARLIRAESEVAGLRHSLQEHSVEAGRREKVAREKVSEQRTDLIASVVADYYRAAAAIADRPRQSSDQEPFIGRQYGIMQHAQTILVRLTGKDSLTVSHSLDASLPVAGEDRMPGDRDERTAALIAPFRSANAGVYAHLAPEDNGPPSRPVPVRH